MISFCVEEAGYNAGTIGSRAMMGLLQEGEIYLSKGKEGPTFADNLKHLGKDPENIYRAKRDPGDLVFFLELHIEQGKVLESAEKQIGVVTAIVGIYRYVVSVRGEAAPAGTTPMHLRQDAAIATGVKGSVGLEDRRVDDGIGNLGIADPQIQLPGLLQQHGAIDQLIQRLLFDLQHFNHSIVEA